MLHDGILLGLFLFTVALLWIARCHSSRALVHFIPGPRPTSWIYGNLPQFLLSEEYGNHEFKWHETYGMVYSIKGCLGESHLLISDPLAAKIILNSPVFVWGTSHRKAANILLGYGNIFLAQGDNHRRLRDIMNPWFSAKCVRTSLPIIRETARKLVDRWEFLGFPGNTADICGTLHNATLDVMGEAILEHAFNALGGQSEICGLQRTVIDSISSLTKLSQLAEAVLPYIPESVLRVACQLLLPGMRTMRRYHQLTISLSRKLVQRKRNDLGSGSDESFISHLIRPTSCDAGVGVPEEEIPVHLRTILLAGDDTSASIIGWVLYKLAQMEDYQQELRTEIQLANPDAMGDVDYNRMPLLNAMINEVLRLYPPLPFADRVATEDCVLPLSQPITTTTGRRISELPIKSGQRLYLSIAAYHRLPSMWGSDAREFRPSRWLEPEPCKGTALGPYASLLTFLGGSGVCLGWRFSILETQVFVTELVRKFVLTLPEDDSVRPCLATTIVPRTADGAQRLPIHIETVS